MLDKLSTFAKILDNDIPVLVYHGNFDLVLPVEGISAALENTPWKHRRQWCEADRQVYHFTNQDSEYKEIMGYRQSYGSLDFVIVRNSGHMVPIDNPAWALKIVRDFLQKTESEDT